MSFAAPWNLLWVLPAAGAVVVLYLLRRPRRNVAVPSTVLWRMLPAEASRATRLQKLSPQLLFFMQLLAAILLALAAAGPKLTATEAGGAAWALVVDDGVGMQASDIAGGRIGQAIAHAQRYVRSAAPGDKIVIAATSPARIAAADPSSRAQELRALSAIRATDGPANVAGAVEMAAAALRATPSPLRRIIVFGDGAWPSSETAAVLHAAGGIPVSLDRTGSRSAVDLGIARFTVERDPASPQTRLQALVEVDATGAPGNASLTVTVGGQTIARHNIAAYPGRPDLSVFEISAPRTAQGATASLAPAGRDDLTADNAAYAVLPAAGVERVLLISGGDAPLERALTLLPGVEVDEASPEAYAATGAPAGYDVYVFDGVAPKAGEPVPRSSLIFGGAGPNFAAASAPEEQSVVDWSRSDPILRFADLYGTVLNTPAWQSVGDWTPLIEASGGVLAASSARGDRRIIRMSFSPVSSGAATRPWFPIVISNAIAWLSQFSGGSSIAGDPITLAPTPGGWRIDGPAGAYGSDVCSTTGSACSFDNTFTAGIYTARSRSETLLFARSTPPSASRIIPRTQPFAPPPAPTSLGKTTERRSETATVCALALALLLSEWWVYHRRRARADTAFRTAIPPASGLASTGARAAGAGSSIGGGRS